MRFFLCTLLIAISVIRTSAQAIPVFDGRLYTAPKSLGITTALYKNGSSTGSITYDEVLYDNLKISYDLTTDNLVVFPEENHTGIIVLQEFIQNFVIYEDLFLYLKNTNIKDGFYHQVYSSEKYVVLAKKSKVSKEYTTDRTIQKSYKELVSYYVKSAETDNMYIPFKNEKSLVKLFPAHKKTLSKKLKDAPFVFKINPESVISFVLSNLEESE